MAVSCNTKPVFKQFDIVSDHSDHQYSKQKSSFTNSTVNNKITAEWRILKKDLPESIYVRVYESRLDLVRAVIIGAEGTTYAGGLFFFDIKFPDNYPNEPPMFHYRSHGLTLNPNLYDTGKVFLSLLNTFFGQGNETWVPSQSTLLQVLVSIQALVLNEKPLFNEPVMGFFNRWFGMKGKSQNYNDDAFISTCRLMLFLLQNPPKNFEAFTAEHFRARASVILKACNVYAKHGCYYNKESEVSSARASKKFKESIMQLYPLLVKAFEKNEASLKKNAVKEVMASLKENAVKEVMASLKKNPVKEVMASLKKNPVKEVMKERTQRSVTTFTYQVKKKVEQAFTPGRLFSAAVVVISVAYVALCKSSVKR